MDPVGFTLEHFDWLGAFRSDEGGLPINSEAAVGPPLFDKPTNINGAPALGKALSLSPLAWSCFAAHWLAYATGGQYREVDSQDRFG